MQYSLSSSQLVPSCYSSLAPGSNYAKPTCPTTKPTCKPTCDVDSSRDNLCKPTKPTCDVDSFRDNLCKPTKPTCDVDSFRDNSCKPTCDIDLCQDHFSSCNAYHYDIYTNSCDAGVFSY